MSPPSPRNNPPTASEINQTTDQICGIAADTAKGMKQTSRAIRDLAEQAEKLRPLVADYKNKRGEE